ncbi:hypothetical protein Aduo_002561 [Ancylostoma duodenale]
MHFVFLLLVGNCSKRRKGDYTKSAASDVASEDVVEKKDGTHITARSGVEKKSSPSSSAEQKGKVTKKKLRDLSDEPSLSRSKLQGSSELESEESLKGRLKQYSKETASQPASPGRQAHDKFFNVEQTQLASITVTPSAQDIEPTQYPEPSPIATRTEGTPPPSSTEKNESTNSSGQTASKDSPVPLHGEKTESPGPVHGEKTESPAPVHGEKMESPVPVHEEKMESHAPAHEEKVGSPVSEHGEKRGSAEKVEGEKRGSAEKTESAPSSIVK